MNYHGKNINKTPHSSSHAESEIKNTKNEETYSANEITMIEKKIHFFYDLMERTTLHVQKNKLLEIIGVGDVHLYLENSIRLHQRIKNLEKNVHQQKKDTVVDELQNINNEISSLMKDFGTQFLEDLLLVCLGKNTILQNNPLFLSKYEFINHYFHPVSYKISVKKESSSKKTTTTSHPTPLPHPPTQTDIQSPSSAGTHESTTTQSVPSVPSAPSSIKVTTLDHLTIDENMKNLDCFELMSDHKSFYMKTFGMKIYISNQQKHMVIHGFLDPILTDCFHHSFYESKKKQWEENKPFVKPEHHDLYERFIGSLHLKEILLYDSSDILHRFNAYLTSMETFHRNTLNQNIKDFLSNDLYGKRNTIISLLIDSKKHENLYMAYLLYDLLSNDQTGNLDSKDQLQILDSFTWSLKQLFKHAIRETIQYNQQLTNFDMNKIPLEQQICLMNAPDQVKEKAMIKLKEIKSKSDENCSKAKQYLDGLLKIPFRVYKREPSLEIMNHIRSLFKKMTMDYSKELSQWNVVIPPREKYTNVEIIYFMKEIKNKVLLVDHPTFQTEKTDENQLSDYRKKIHKSLFHDLQWDHQTKKKMIEILQPLNGVFHFSTNEWNKIKKEGMIQKVTEAIQTLQPLQLTELEKLLNHHFLSNPQNKKTQQRKENTVVSSTSSVPSNSSSIHPSSSPPPASQSSASSDQNQWSKELKREVGEIENQFVKIQDYLTVVKQKLDDSVFGHEKAKKQIEKIVGQWMNGFQDGYCFGFEGPPGVGKTSLAKRGLSECLKDEHGNSRPFAMIQMGGESNGSTLHGHNYTYVGSTWGSIVQILMDKKCMNPIIFIDEVDKISKTEHGREITGILTHLLDSTQNDCFQDKYFSGIDLDLSKALFILSYNDVNSIDKILLDRIHRIKFSHLSLKDKLVISNTYILPEIYRKMGLENMILVTDETLTFIIEEYTSESGVRKLKEILFEMIGEFNLNVLKNCNTLFENAQIPFEITKEHIKQHYFKDRTEMKSKKIHQQPAIGVINGLWANAYGQGGVIQIQTMFFPCDYFLNLKLTGMQGDVMKESMNVALTLAWRLTPESFKEQIQLQYHQEKQPYGIHIHCPEGSVPKDGPSAGAAITTVIFSLFNDKKIKNNVAITGEISLDGTITEIGGLDLKILGGIKAGVTHFLFPKENRKDFDLFMEKYKNTHLIDDISFHPVGTIEEVFEQVFV